MSDERVHIYISKGMGNASIIIKAPQAFLDEAVVRAKQVFDHMPENSMRADSEGLSIFGGAPPFPPQDLPGATP